MPLPDFTGLSTGVNVAAFTAAAIVVWLAGTRLSGYADAIAERTGAGQAFIGALLLGGVTSLPEGATVVTAAAIGNAPLAVNNLLGGVAMQVTILAAADFLSGSRALTADVARPSLLLEGALLVLLLGLAVAALVLGDRLVIGVGIGSFAILVTSLVAFLLIRQHEPRDTWEPEGADADSGRAVRGKDGESNGSRDLSTGCLAARTTAAALAILAAGIVLARSGDALAEQTGLGSGFVGAVLVAIATSLPEVSTTLGAVRLGQHVLAISNLLGANILDMSLLFLADLVYPGGPVLAGPDRFAAATALLGLLLTTIYLVGMIERRRSAVARLGVDSILVLALYLGGMFLLYRIR